jgi:hypothetical protein
LTPPSLLAVHQRAGSVAGLVAVVHEEGSVHRKRAGAHVVVCRSTDHVVCSVELSERCATTVIRRAA